MLIWLHACRVLQRKDLETIAWPDGAPASTMNTALSRWIQARFITPIDNSSRQRGQLQRGTDRGDSQRPKLPIDLLG
jgi:hypothetical protein